MKRLLALVALVPIAVACSSEGGNGSGDGSCAWHGNCSTRAPNGGYDCSGNTLMKCVDGQWSTVVGCGSTHDGKGYACTCKGGCGMDTTACSYAFAVCEGMTFPTCGPKTPVLTTSWACK